MQALHCPNIDTRWTYEYDFFVFLTKMAPELVDNQSTAEARTIPTEGHAMASDPHTISTKGYAMASDPQTKSHQILLLPFLLYDFFRSKNRVAFSFLSFAVVVGPTTKKIFNYTRYSIIITVWGLFNVI